MRAALGSKSQADREVVPALPADSKEMSALRGSTMKVDIMSALASQVADSTFHESDGMIVSVILQKVSTWDEAVDTGD